MAQPVNPVVDFGHNRAPIYIQLSTLFRRFIVSGQWPIDQQIPTHDSLAVQFEVNPATIRKAIEILEQEGLVASYRRRGTFVTAKPLPTDRIDIPTDWNEAADALAHLNVTCLASHLAKGEPMPFHGAGPFAKAYQYTRRLYAREKLPVIVEDAFIDAEVRRSFGGRRSDGKPLLGLIASDPAISVTRADDTILFGIADREIAALLAVPLNTPVAVVHQSLRTHGERLISEVKAYYRGDTMRIAEPIRFS